MTLDSARSTLVIQDIEVFSEGEGPGALVMIHGWPDTHRLWDSSVQALKPFFRCVRFTLPGFDLEKLPRATSLARMAALIADIVDAVSPDRPVDLMLHDWGCVFGYEFAAARPERVARIVSVDIGDYNSRAYKRSLSVQAKVLVFAYQFWLAVAWTLRGAVADAMTRWMARKAGCPAPAPAIGWQMNYPYAMVWFGVMGGFQSAAPVTHACPMLFIYGERKPFMFHSVEWLTTLGTRPGCAVRPFSTGHWVMAQQPSAFNQCAKEWLVSASSAR
jgi:pimeloyl-ACP methyl ester carboxylesterase